MVIVEGKDTPSRLQPEMMFGGNSSGVAGWWKDKA